MMISHRGGEIKEEFFTETTFLQFVGGSEANCCQLFKTYCHFGQVKLLNEVNKTEMNNRYYLCTNILRPVSEVTLVGHVSLHHS